MREGGPDRQNENAARHFEMNGGTGNNRREEGQAGAVCDENAGDETTRLMEEVLRRENLMAAYKTLKQMGLKSLLDEYRRFAHSM